MPRAALPAAALAVALLLAACGGVRTAQRETPSTQAPSGPTTTAAPVTTAAPTTPAPEATLRLRVYLLRGGRVAPVAREVPRTPAVATAALRELLAGPTAPEGVDLGSTIPADTVLRSLSIAGGTATADFSAGFAANGDAATVRERLAQVVYTLTQFPTVQRALVEADGRPLGGGPLGRADLEDVAPAILVESPLPGDTVSSPLRVVGTADAYEGTFLLDLRTASGALVEHRVVHATSGSGVRGSFDAAVAFAGAGPATLAVYERSAEDGSVRNLVEIPLRLAP